MPKDEIEAVVDTWADTYRRLGAREDIRYVLIFENRGTLMGNSQPHPHGQVYAYGEIPDLMVLPQLSAAAAYRAFAGTCTHLACTVQYRESQNDIFCACHNGVYDIEGRNVSGPPPRYRSTNSSSRPSATSSGSS